MSRPRLRAVVAVPVVVLALSLAACGGGSTAGAGGDDSSAASTASGDAAAYAKTPAAQIQSDLESALKGASSLHMAGSIVETNAAIDFDVSVDTSGHCTGTMGLQGSTIQLLGSGGDYYFKAPRSFWHAQDPAHATQIWGIVGGKWVKMGGQESEMSSLCNLTDFTHSLFAQRNDQKGTTVVGPSQFGGQPTVELAGVKPPTKIQVLAAAPHYPVHVDAGSQGEITFSRFDEPVTVTAPSSGEVVDLSQLG